MRIRSFRWRRATLVFLLLVGALVLALWLIPSGKFLLLPDKAQPVDPIVKVGGEDEEDAAAAGGIYMVDILVRRANILERLFPGLNEGSTLIADDAINPEGVSDEQRRASNRLDMTRSQQVAAAVAFEALGYEVEVQASGAEISLVLPGSPADEIGLQPGDVIVAAQGRVVETLEDLRAALATVEPGTEVTISVQRSGGITDYTLATQAAEDDPGRAVIGVRVQEAAVIDLPVDVEIDAGRIGGPSAGLAFALDIVDELGTEVDRGRTIVVTGELRLDGSVEAIGGIKQKTIAAVRAGADLFVVPADNAEEAERYAEDVEVVAVSTFDEALADLGVVPAA